MSTFLHVPLFLYVCVVVVVQMGEEVTLTCSAKTTEAVTWKFKGDSLKNSLFDYKEDIQNLTLPEVEKAMLGEYSCWRGEKKLSSTYLLDQDESITKPSSTYLLVDQDVDQNESRKEGEILFMFTYF